jgi:hypothetical protein
MSQAKITSANRDDNEYTISIAGWGSFIAQAVTGDVYEVDDVVEVVDIDNLPPDQAKVKGYLRMLPVRGNYTYTATCLWYTVGDLTSRQKIATLARNYIFSNKENPRWQRECPLYRKGQIVSFDTPKYANVRINRPWKGIFEYLRCRIDYMTCDGDAFEVGSEVVVQFLDRDERRGVVVGFWDNPGLCEGLLYFALKIDQTITEDEIFGAPVSESSVESSESLASESSRSSDSERLKGLEDYYCFLWDPSINDFPVINDAEGSQIQFPCRADVLEEFLLNSSDISSASMTRTVGGRHSVLADRAGPSKDHFYEGNWNIPDLRRCYTHYVGGGPWLFDGTCIDPGSDEHPDKWEPNYPGVDTEPLVYPNWEYGPGGHDDDECCDPVGGTTYPGGAHWWADDVPYATCTPGGVPVEICPESCDSRPYAWAHMGTWYEDKWEEFNPLSGSLDFQYYSVLYKCTNAGGDVRQAYAESELYGVNFTDDNWPLYPFNSYILSFDGFQSDCVTKEHYVYDKDLNFTSGCGEIKTDDTHTAEYNTETFMGYLYGNGIPGDPNEYWPLVHYYARLVGSYYADILMKEDFVVGKRCQSGTFVWLGIQGTRVRLTDWGDPPDYPTLVVTKEEEFSHNLAYCDSVGYGFDPFEFKQNNTKISDAIGEIIQRFYAQQSPGITLGFEYDVRWITGQTESYSSFSSSSLSSSSSSSSSLSLSKSSVSSSSQSSQSSESTI